MYTDLTKSQFVIKGESGLPDDYPVPKDVDNLLFFIQRNLNKNTLVYTLNKNPDGLINQDYPINVNWINYSSDGSQGVLNNIQKKAFGYKSRKINNTTYECCMTSYKKLKFFVSQEENGHSATYCNINGSISELKNIYVYADEFGIFPQVKYIELFGCNNKQAVYERIVL